ncbi:MAG TPA: YafY family protein [Bacillota bacterium]|nr:YafY family protein [Bacillota bacterium]
MRLHRLIAILLLMESRGSVKAKEMAAALETSERTIYRDIDILCEAGLPITATTGPSGGFSYMEGYSVSLKNFHYDDAITLFLSGIGIRPEGDSDAGLKLKAALSKLESNLPAEYQSDIRAARERFYFEPDDWWEEKKPFVVQESIRQAVWRSTKLMIDYRKPNGESQTRIVRPYGLVVKNAEWYLVAYCEMSKGLRTFKCERILDARHLDEAFTIPKDFSLEEYWRENAKAFKTMARKKDMLPVVLRVSDDFEVDTLKALGNLPDQAIKNEGGARQLTLNAYSYPVAYHGLLDLGDQVEVLGPSELRTEIERKIKAVAKNYRIQG